MKSHVVQSTSQTVVIRSYKKITAMITQKAIRRILRYNLVKEIIILLQLPNQKLVLALVLLICL
jgi:hypothetical protein